MMTVKSPCLNKCKLGPDGYCVACFREMQDIANWATYSDKHKLDIINEIKRKRDNVQK